MRVLPILALYTLSAAAMRAQSGPDQYGRITDIDGRPILGAEVVASCAGKRDPIRFHVDEKGDYALGFGEPNGIECSLEVRAQGYKALSIPKDTYHACANVRVDYKLSAVGGSSHLNLEPKMRRDQ